MNEINALIVYLVDAGLADAQYFAHLRSIGSDSVLISFGGARHIAVALRDRGYDEIYQHLLQERTYNVKMLDGALIQMTYSFVDETVERHRLAFFPAPHLEEYQNNPEIYESDEIYADVVARNIVPFPVRFDYDAGGSGGMFAHPLSHLTLGQYQNCRIPVNAPITPMRFMDFILRNFYHTAFVLYADELPGASGSFGDTIRPEERKVVHVVVP